MRRKEIKIIKTVNIFSNQKGMALLTTLIFVFILVTFAVALLTMTSNDTKLSALQRDSTRAFYLAETGIEKALWYLNTPSGSSDGGLNWRTDGFKQNYPVGSTNYYEFKIEDTILPDPNLIEPIKINSKGVIYDGNKIYGSRQVQIIAVKKTSPSSEVGYNYAIITDGDLTLRGGISIHNGKVHSNGNFDHTKIGGGGDFTIDGEITAVGTVSGIDGTSGVLPVDLPTVSFDFYKDLAVKGLHEGKYYETSVNFDSNKELSGIHFINGDVTINSEITINGGAIFATGTITTLGNAKVIHTRRTDWGEDDPLNNNPLAIIARGDIEFKGSSISTDGVIQSYGLITMSGNITVANGAVVAGEGIINGGGGPATVNITYDPTLFGKDIPGVGIEIYKILSWQEVY
ncbi:hypothetical protein CVT91_10140 [Candidatus Atribacteria bacterium HGW-Atribacteria-1]|nr:MAG: hypothetical protein CVT91_10140 [Candidatus Atribacteria bacterium HGW-Atribacteria-1]